jgi:predicted permease
VAEDRNGFRTDRRPWPAEIVRDIDDEIQAHLDERRQELATAGLSPEQAAAEAARRFGNREEVAEACRLIDRQHRDRARRAAMLTDLWQDLAHALRLFRRSPGFAAVAIGTLAVGMGATTTIFTLANWALLRPVPGVTEPENVSVIWIGRSNSDQSFSVARISYPNLADAAARLTSIAIGGYQTSGSVAISGGGHAARNVSTQYVTGSYFDVLGVRMQIGRPFTSVEDTPPSPLLGAVISDRLWQSMFQRSPDVLQQTLDVAGVTFSILGVAPPAFHGTERLSMIDLWLPGASTPIVRRFAGVTYDSRARGAYYELVARLKPGATWAQAQAELDSFRAWLGGEYPTENADGFSRMGFRIMGPIGPPPMARHRMQAVVGLTAGGASTLVMLIACANVAGLLMIRGVARRGEIGVRKALGAGRWRLIRQQLAEGTVLWMFGGVAALATLALLRETVNVAALVGLGGSDAIPPIDWRVLAFTGIVSLVVGMLASIGPAVRATRVEASETLRAALPTATRRMFVGTSLAVFQLAASLTLLIGAFLLVGTLRHLTRVPLGFDPEGLFVLQLRPQSIGYNDAQSLAYLEAFQQRLRGVRDVHAVSAGQAVPFLGGPLPTRVRRVDDDPHARPLEPDSTYIFSSDYFSTLGIPLLQGRTFTEAEFSAARRGAARPVIVSDRLAQRLFAAEHPLGRELVFPVLGREGQRYQIVGVVGTARFGNLVSEPDDMVYEPGDGRAASRETVLVVRAGASARIAKEARRIAAELNPSLPLTGVQSMAQAVGRARSEWDSLARLLWILAVTAALLACVGLYGVIGHGVAQRRREFGIRVALGASHRDVWRLVLRRTATITIAGLAFGLAGGYAFAQILSARLVGVNPLDPGWWSLATLSLVAVAVLASVRPALVATRVDVSTTLRAQ